MEKFELLLNEENFEELMTTEVEPFLASLRIDDTFISFDGKKIHYEGYMLPDAKATVVIVHGFTESAEKFRELSYYYLKNNMNVFAIDNRGHGHSYRLPGDLFTVRLEKFDDYINDLDVFVKDVVMKKSGSLPLYLYGHSMGGAVSARYLEEHPESFEKAILNAPMICAQTGMSIFAAKALSGTLCAFGKKHASVPGKCEFYEGRTYLQSDDTSKARFDYYHAKRLKEPNYQTSGPSFGWVKESMHMTDVVLSDAKCKRVAAKVLILQPETDRKVISEYENKFCDKINDGRLVRFMNSKHEIYNSTNDVLHKYYTTIFDFLG